MLHHNALDDPSDATLDHIDRIVDRVADEVHKASLPDADLLQDSRWYASARPTRRKLLTTAAAAPVRSNTSVPPGKPHSKTFEVHDGADAAIANKVAHAPLSILVEDREADGVLLEIIAETCGSPSFARYWERALGVVPPALRIENAGGIGGMPARVERARLDAEAEGRPLRLFALCDSDARWPNDNDHGSVRAIAAIAEVCQQHGVPLHVLKKRCAESYIPDEVFEVVRDDPRNTERAHCFDALLRRSSVQRDHFPVKDGLKPAERDQACRAGLYDEHDVSEVGDLALLEARLFARRPRPLQRLAEERRAHFTADGLRQRDGSGELDELLHAIAAEV